MRCQILKVDGVSADSASNVSNVCLRKWLKAPDWVSLLLWQQWLSCVITSMAAMELYPLLKGEASEVPILSDFR